MGIVLQILGGIVLLIVALGVAAWLWLRWQIGRMKKLAKMMGGPVAPVRIHLEPVSEAVWRDPRQVERMAEEFAAAGFSRAGTYRLREVSEVVMAPFVAADGMAYGLITEHPMAGVFAEVVQSSADGHMLTISQAKVTDQSPPPPHKTVIRRTGASVTELLSEYEAHRLPPPIAPHTAAGFPAAFEAAYHRDMTWAYEHGPLKGMNVEQISDLIGEDPDPETYRLLKQQNPLDYPDELEHRLRQTFLKQSGMSALEWDEMRDHIVLVHDRLSSDDLADMLADEVDDEEIYTIAEKHARDSARDTFQQMVDRLNLSDRLDFLAHVDDPLPCDVYRFRVRV